MFVRRSLFPALAILLLASPALADSIPVPDFDFSNPIAPTTGFQTTPSTSAGLGSWQVSPPPDGFPAAQWYDQAGVFYNDPSGEFITNLSGSQGGYMFATPGLQLSQTLSSTFQVGKSYQLTVGIGGGSSEAPGGMAVGTTMQIGLYYLDGGGNPVLIGTTNVVNETSLPSPAFVTSLTDYDLTIPAVGASDPWAGQNIGVALIQPNTAPGDGSFWDVDNVRLATVPEPGTIGLLAAAGLSLFVLGRRRFFAKRTGTAHD